MKLSQLFSGDTHTENVARPGQSPAQAANMNRQIRSLVPGQTISGEVLSRSGGEVQIKISEDLVLNARVDRNMNIEVGKNMTFEVKNNGSSLTLSPLFTNVSTDMNVLKALDMAGLPVNQTSVSMTEQMMQAGLSVNKNILQQIFREINSFPQNEISDVINLHRLQLPVNTANMEQMAAYRSLNHQLLEGIDTVLDSLPEVFDAMVEEGDIPGAMRLYREILDLIRQGVPGGETGHSDGPDHLSMQGDPAGRILAGEAWRPSGTEMQLAEEGMAWIPEQGREAEGGITGKGIGPAEEAGLPEGESVLASESLRAGLVKETLEMLEGFRLPEKTGEELYVRLMQFARGESGDADFFSVLGSIADAAKTSENAMQSLERIFSGAAFKEMLTGQLKKFWTLSAREVEIPGKVEEMYRHLDRQLKGIAQALENAGQTDSAAFKASASMSRNVDFLQQINQMYAYVQLPLRLQQRDAHGELYVYTNKRNLAAREGSVSALLHLDMENLGPVDVYVTMQSSPEEARSRVNTKFFLRDEEMIDFMSAHMEILTERLKKRGYDCSFAMTAREQESDGAAGGGLSPILKQEKGIALSQYAFDVRT